MNIVKIRDLKVGDEFEDSMGEVLKVTAVTPFAESTIPRAMTRRRLTVITPRGNEISMFFHGSGEVTIIKRAV